MNADADKVAGISIAVEDLVRVRGHLSGLSLASIRRRASYRSGAREVRLRGRGMEYEESRAYVSGDDSATNPQGERIDVELDFKITEFLIANE